MTPAASALSPRSAAPATPPRQDRTAPSPTAAATAAARPPIFVTPTPEPQPAPGQPAGAQGPTPTPESLTLGPKPSGQPATADPDSRYGAVFHTTNASTQRWLLGQLGIEWFTDGTEDIRFIPAGHNKLILISSLPGPDADKLRQMARNAPGAVWAIVNEPNRRGDDYAADAIVEELDELYSAIRTADPTARITSPPVLNWRFTCEGCPGYMRGITWIEEFRDAFLTNLGKEPPVDIWAINVYPLDWVNLPTVNPQIPIDQVSGLAEYLQATYPGEAKPIWIPELSLHWGWDDILFRQTGCLGRSPSPAGTYQTAQVIDYLDSVYDWPGCRPRPCRRCRCLRQPWARRRCRRGARRWRWRWTATVAHRRARRPRYRDLR